MGRRYGTGIGFGIAYAVLLTALVVLFARWDGGPGWSRVTQGLLVFPAVSVVGVALARRLSFVGLPLLFLGGLPAQLASFYLLFVDPRILYLPFPDRLAAPLTGAVAAMVGAWFLGFFLLLAPPARAPVDFVELTEAGAALGAADANE